MKILKYKKRANGKYSLFLDDGREFVFYEEVILQYNLLITKEIQEKDLLIIHQSNLEYDVYYTALNYIKSHFKSIYEIKQYLIRKEYPEDLVLHAIEKLKKQKYLDDQAFAKSFIYSQMITTNHGPNKIRADLKDKRVSQDIIEEEILSYTEEEQITKIRKLIERGIKTNKHRGGLVLKQKIINDLKNQGFYYELIMKEIDTYDFSNDKDLAKKEYEKYYQKYSKKYEGYELINKIREKMFQKGLYYEEE